MIPGSMLGGVRRTAAVAGGVLFVGVAGVLALWALRPRLSEEVVRDAVYTTIQREAPESFYVTGHVDLVTTTTVENTKYLFPDLLDLNLGTTRATVRVPGRVSYGLDVDRLRPEMIELEGDTLVQVTLPELRIYSVEPNLAELEVETTVGWARLYAHSGRTAEQRAIRSVGVAMRRQGAAHLRGSVQPRINTARALEALLTPVLIAAGVAEPRFRFQIGSGIVMEAER